MPRTDDVTPECLAEIERVYAELDDELRALGHDCRGCGDCCDLVRHGFRLYLSTLELALVLEQAGIGRLPPQREGRCGFQSGPHCTIHAFRPLGCRTYFCKAEGQHLSELYEKYLKKLKALAERYACVWEYCQKYPE